MRNIYKVIALIVFFSISIVGWGQSVSTDAATSITGNSAILNATASGLDPAKTYYVEYYYGTAANHFEYYIKSDNFTGASTANFPLLTNEVLNSNTEYFFTAYLWEADVTPPPPFTDIYIGDGSELSFTTQVVSVGISTEAANNITTDKATLNATATGLDVGETYYVLYYYGPASNHYQYSMQSANVTGVSTASFPLETDVVLNSDTEYFFSAYLYEIDATPPPPFVDVNVASGAELSFTTAAPLEISLYSPAQDAINISITPLLQLEFNQDVQFIDPLAEYKILLRQGGSTIDEFIVAPGFIDGNLQFDGTGAFTSNRLNITPYTILEVNTLYHIIIPSRLIQSLNGELFGGITSSTGWQFTTVAEPVWASGYPLTRNLSPTAVDLVGQTDKSGTYYYVVTASDISPTIAQIKAGQDEVGSATAFVSGSGVMTGGAEFIESIDISDYDLYDPEITYYIYMVATDDVNSLDSEIGQTSFTTLERNAPITSFDPMDGSIGVSTLSNVIISFDEPVRMADGTIIDDSNVASLIRFYLSPATPVAFTATIDPTKSIITVVPGAPLNADSGYEITMFAVEDYYGNEQLSSSTASFSTTNLVAWNGSQSSDWLDDRNWDENFNSGNSVQIPASALNMPIISSDETVGHLMIEAGASLEIINTGSLIINETLTMGSSTSGSGNATLIDNGSSSVSVDPSKVAIYQEIIASDRTYHFSSPVVGATKTNMGVDNAIMRYENATDSWTTLGDNQSLSVGSGYILRSSANVIFTGALNNNSSYSVPLIRTDGAGYGWNLVGNPFTAAIDWDAIDAGFKNNINDAYWIFLNDATNYGVYATYSPIGGGTNGLDNVIPTHQGYFVKVLIGQTSGSLTVPKTAMVKNNKSILKSVQKSSKIKLAGVNGELEDEVIIAFSDIANDGDDIYDASKRFASKTSHMQLFSYENSTPYAINCKKELFDGLVIPLGFNVAKAGVYAIRLKETVGELDDYDVYLKDNSAIEENSMFKIKDSIYEFSTSKSGSVYDRFEIHFVYNPLATSIGNDYNELITVYSYDKIVYIKGNHLDNGLYQIYSLNGRLIDNGKLLNGELNSIHVGKEGLFIVKVISEKETISQKVLLK